MSQSLSLLYLFGESAERDADPWRRRAVQLMTAFGGRARQVAAVDKLPNGVPATLAQNPPPLSGAVSVARYEAIARAMRGYDLVLSFGAGAIDAVMARRAFPRGAPPIVHHEDPAAMTSGGSARLYRRIALGAAAGLVVTGKGAAEAAAGCWKVAAARLHTIADGVDLSAFARGPDTKTVAGFRRKPGEVAIGIMLDGASDDELALLVRAVAGLAARFRLIVVGEGEGRAAVERTALAMGIDDRLVLPGALSPGAAWLGGLDVLLLPLRLARAPAIVIEAMAAGVPVMALRGGAVEVLLAPDNRALLSAHAAEVSLRDALQPLASDATLRAATGAANRAQALAVHDVAAMIARSAAVYSDAIGGPALLG
ncbi:glycosyltransferase family 4 protein [Sphingomonas endophytica]|uniref:Glycosyltransferase involved in cell wall biosynthesis n=1 Tax=Sphingomonas endophytica TaxID=869719 RepID=A0ABR6N327_9SPHN|nr:glycosyltransferase [Sphingomonas endophytica]MBB5725188.1 glycosyltransferase involved in cell wall biosynthesis [Sphingomonas endophytica]